MKYIKRINEMSNYKENIVFKPSGELIEVDIETINMLFYDDDINIDDDYFLQYDYKLGVYVCNDINKPYLENKVLKIQANKKGNL